MDFTYLIEELTRGFTNFTWGNAVMILVGAGVDHAGCGQGI